MLLLKALARLVGMIWMLALALLGLGIALYCLDAFISLGSVRPDRLLGLPGIRRHVGHFLDQIAAHGPTAALALLCGLGAMLIGCLLVRGTLGSRRQRLAVLEHDADNGTLAARPGTLRDMARALAEQATDASGVKRPKLSLSRRGRRGRLKVTASRPATSDPREVQNELKGRLEPISEPFHLKPRVRVRLGEPGERVL
ncbi:MAG: hypothetical protein M3Z27_09590 [Actinomycetota bacterium]|nr:hypothetical protein [Actinomycetota bacterium]